MALGEHCEKASTSIRFQMHPSFMPSLPLPGHKTDGIDHFHILFGGEVVQSLFQTLKKLFWSNCTVGLCYFVSLFLNLDANQCAPLFLLQVWYIQYREYYSTCLKDTKQYCHNKLVVYQMVISEHLEICHGAKWTCNIIFTWTFKEYHCTTMVNIQTIMVLQCKTQNKVVLQYFLLEMYHSCYC